MSTVDKAFCPYCGTPLEYIETLESDWDIGTIDYRLDLENWWCNKCDKGFDVEAYYEYQPVFFGKIRPINGG